MNVHNMHARRTLVECGEQIEHGLLLRIEDSLTRGDHVKLRGVGE